jgi:hypothetical protein
MQMKTNDWLAQECSMFEEYLHRMYPNVDIFNLLNSDKALGKGKKRGDKQKDDFVPLSAEEKSNICSNELDAVMQSMLDIEKKGQDEISEART